MTRLALRHDAVNLAQGFPDFQAPEELKEAARRAIGDDLNQYAITWGAKPFRDAISAKYSRAYGFELDPEIEITVVCGSTEGMIASLLATTDPEDEVVIFEPFYENYGPDADLCSARRRYVRLYPPDWHFDPDELRAAFSAKTKAVILNTPHNPTGKVFTYREMELIAALCREFDALCVTDEIYEHITYDGAAHIPMITLPDMRQRTVVVNSMSKSYSVTGWRVGWVIAPSSITAHIRKVHDFLTVGAAAPLQQAGVFAMSLPDSYYRDLAAHYLERRDILLGILESSGLRCYRPAGAYYIMSKFDDLGYSDDIAFCSHLIEKIGVAAVPGSSFLSGGEWEPKLIRFCFCKKYETLSAAGQRLRRLSS